MKILSLFWQHGMQARLMLAVMVLSLVQVDVCYASEWDELDSQAQSRSNANVKWAADKVYDFFVPTGRGDNSSNNVRQSVSDEADQQPSWIKQEFNALLFPQAQGFNEQDEQGQADRLIEAAGLNPNDFVELGNGIAVGQWIPTKVVGNVYKDFKSSIQSYQQTKREQEIQRKQIKDFYQKYNEKSYTVLRNDLEALRESVSYSQNERIINTLKQVINNAQIVVQDLEKEVSKQFAEEFFNLVRPSQQGSLMESVNMVKEALQDRELSQDKRQALMVVQKRLMNIYSEVERYKRAAEGDLEEALAQAQRSGVNKPSLFGSKSTAGSDKEEIIAVLQQEAGKFNQKELGAVNLEREVNRIVKEQIDAFGQENLEEALVAIEEHLNNLEMQMRAAKGAHQKQIREQVKYHQHARAKVKELHGKSEQEMRMIDQKIASLLAEYNDDKSIALDEMRKKISKSRNKKFDEKVIKELDKQIQEDQKNQHEDQRKNDAAHQLAEDLVVKAEYPALAMNVLAKELTKAQAHLMNARKLRGAAQEVKKATNDIEQLEYVKLILPAKVEYVQERVADFWQNNAEKDMKAELVRLNKTTMIKDQGSEVARVNKKIEKMVDSLMHDFTSWDKAQKSSDNNVWFDSSSQVQQFDGHRFYQAVKKELTQNVKEFRAELKKESANDPFKKLQGQLNSGNVAGIPAALEELITATCRRMGIDVNNLTDETRVQIAANVEDTSERLLQVIQSPNLSPAQKELQKQIIVKGMVKENGLLLASYATGASQAALLTGDPATVAVDMMLNSLVRKLMPEGYEQ